MEIKKEDIKSNSKEKENNNTFLISRKKISCSLILILILVSIYSIILLINDSKKEAKALSSYHDLLMKTQSSIYTLKTDNNIIQGEISRLKEHKIPNGETLLLSLTNKKKLLLENKNIIEKSVNDSLIKLRNLENEYQKKQTINEDLNKEKSLLFQKIQTAKGLYYNTLYELEKLIEEEEKISSEDLNEKFNLKSESNIINSDEQISFIVKWIRETNSLKIKNFKLLYRASENKFSEFTFHEICGKEDIKNTLVIIKTENQDIIGGFTYGSWEPNRLFSHDEDAFVFNLNKKIRIEVSTPFQAIYSTVGYGPTFGIADLIVSGNIVKAQDKMVCYEGKNLGISDENLRIEDYEVFTAIFSED